MTVTLDDVRAAAALLTDVAVRTPIESSRPLSALLGRPVLLKAENLQRAGSFKIRGAYVRISHLSAQEKARGVVAASAGNHAQGVALAASTLGIRSTVFMPEANWAKSSRRCSRFSAKLSLASGKNCAPGIRPPSATASTRSSSRQKTMPRSRVRASMSSSKTSFFLSASALKSSKSVSNCASFRW